MANRDRSLEHPERAPAIDTWWTHIHDAVKGVHHDDTDGPVGRSLWLLAIPMVLETLMESLFAVCDVFFVSRLGADAVAVVGLTESMLSILYALAMGLSIGATATVARRIGEEDADGAARAAVQAIALGLGVSVAVGPAGGLAASNLRRAMGATPAIVELGTTYTRLMLGGNAAVVLIVLINAVFRGAGDAAIAMRVLWLANAINIPLGPCLVFGLGPFPELGVTGAALATNLGRGTGVVFQLWMLTRPGRRMRVEARHLGLELSVMRGIWRLSSTGVFQILISTTSRVFLVRILSAFGSAVVAGNTILARARERHAEPERHEGDAQRPWAGHGEPRDVGLGREDGHDRPRTSYEHEAHDGEAREVVARGQPRGRLGTIELSGPKGLSHHRRCRVCQPPCRQDGEDHEPDATARETRGLPRGSTLRASGHSRSRWPACSRVPPDGGRWACTSPSVSPSRCTPGQSRRLRPRTVEDTDGVAGGPVPGAKEATSGMNPKRVRPSASSSRRVWPADAPCVSRQSA